MRSHDEQGRGQIQRPEPARERDAHHAEQHVIGQHAYQNKNHGIGKQLAGNGRKNVHPGRAKPVVAGAELDLAADGVNGDQQHDHLEQDEKERLAQVNRVVQIGIVERMALRGDRNQKALGRPLAHPQRDGLGDDRRHRQRLKHRLESAAHLAADAQQRIVIIVAERRPATAPKVGLETRRNDQIAVNFLTLRRRPGRLLVGVMSAHAESRHGLDGARDAARRGRPVQIDHADRNALHLARAEDRRHEQNAEQRQRDAHAEIEPAGNHPPELAPQHGRKARFPPPFHTLRLLAEVDQP